MLAYLPPNPRAQVQSLSSGYMGQPQNPYLQDGASHVQLKNSVFFCHIVHNFSWWSSINKITSHQQNIIQTNLYGKGKHRFSGVGKTLPRTGFWLPFYDDDIKIFLAQVIIPPGFYEIFLWSRLRQFIIHHIVYNRMETNTFLWWRCVWIIFFPILEHVWIQGTVYTFIYSICTRAYVNIQIYEHILDINILTEIQFWIFSYFNAIMLLWRRPIFKINIESLFGLACFIFKPAQSCMFFMIQKKVTSKKDKYFSWRTVCRNDISNM